MKGLAAFLVLALLAACSAFPAGRSGSGYPPPLVGAVVSEHPIATAVGLAILEEGGNAVDAAVGTALALAVVYPQAGNLGGGGFALWVPHEDPEGPLFLDFRETAPAGLTAAAFLDGEGQPDADRSLRGHLAPGVPGSPMGLWTLQRRLGRMSFLEVATPAIDLARKGFAVDAWLARDLRRDSARGRLTYTGAAAALFYPGGEALAEGARLVQPDLGSTLERLAIHGPREFYGGPVAEAIIDTLQAGGGVMTLADLLGYEAVWREPLRGWFRGNEVISAPPPSSGGLVLLQVLSILDGFPLDEERTRTRAAREDEAGHGLGPEEVGLSGRALHWWIEAMRCAFADRATHMGDPDFHDVPVEALLSPEWIAERRVTIGERATPGIEPLPPPRTEGGETTHHSVLDRDGNALCLTTTLNTSFGCGLMVPGLGILLNNELDDFAIHAGVPNVFGLVGGEANALQPGKRPLSSMTPTVIREGGRATIMVIGSPGGPRIISAVLQVILRTSVYGEPLATAIAAPRLHQQWNPAKTWYEDGWDALLLQDLTNRDHVLERRESPMGSVQAIFLPAVGGQPVAVSDPRRGGAPGIEDEGVGLPAHPPVE